MNRYERNIIVEDFGEVRQQRLAQSRVLVVGAGGLGSAVLPYLAAAGVGHIGIVEFDTVSETNLQRQILYTTADLGASKALIAARRLQELNPLIEIKIFKTKLDDNIASEIFDGYDLVIDCTDNYAARYVIDRHSASMNIPMIYGTAQGSSGQISVFNSAGTGSYADLYPEHYASADNHPVGVLSPMPGIIGTLQAMEAIKIITGYGEPLYGKLLVVDAKTMKFSVYEL